MLELVVVSLGLADEVVDGGNGSFEGPAKKGVDFVNSNLSSREREKRKLHLQLHHGVRNLTGPEGRKGLVETVKDRHQKTARLVENTNV